MTPSKWFDMLFQNNNKHTVISTIKREDRQTGLIITLKSIVKNRYLPGEFYGKVIHHEVECCNTHVQVVYNCTFSGLFLGASLKVYKIVMGDEISLKLFIINWKL